MITLNFSKSCISTANVCLIADEIEKLLIKMEFYHFVHTIQRENLRLSEWHAYIGS